MKVHFTRKFLVYALLGISIWIIYILIMYTTATYAIDLELEGYESLLKEHNFETFDMCVQKNARILLDDREYEYSEVKSEVKQLLFQNFNYNIVNLQISPDLEQEQKIGPFTANVKMRCFFESTIHNKSTQAVCNLKLRRTFLGKWKISYINISNYNINAWQ